MNEETLRRSYERLLVIREQETADRDLCPSVDDIHALLRREGDEISRLRRLDHVMQCPECRREFELMRTIERSQPPTPASPWRLWAFAALLVVVIGATLVWQMMNATSRRDILRGPSDHLTLLVPADRAVLSLPATFAWRPVAGALSYRVELLDEAGEVTWASEVSDTTLLLQDRPAGKVAGWRVVADFPNDIPLTSSARAVRLPFPR